MTSAASLTAKVVPVDRARVDEFLMAVGELPVGADGVGSEDGSVPPGFLFYVSTFGPDALHRQAGVTFDDGLFAALRVEILEPVHVGDVLSVRPELGERRPHPSGSRFIEINCDYQRDGATVLRETSTVVQLGQSLSAGADGAPARVASAAEPASAGHPGQQLSADRVQVAFMAAALRDPNPVHVDDDFARGLGLPRAILHGPFVIYHCVAAGSDGQWDRVAGFDVQMRGPIAVGEAFTVEVIERAGNKRRVEARTLDGRKVAVADIAVR